MTIRQEIMGLPPSERLEAVLTMLEALLLPRDEELAWLQREFKLQPREARTLWALNQRFPNLATRDQIYLAIYDHDSDVDPKIIDVFICKLRSKGFKIKTVWGTGFYLETAIEIGEAPPARRRAKQTWSDREDRELKAMLLTGSDLGSIAYELDRTERAVIDRIKRLGLRAPAY